MAEDCRPHQYTHTRHLNSPPLSFSGWGLVFPFFRLFGVSARLFCCLVPLALASYSVRGVGCSRPEPWTRLHCSESHWREPVVVSAGQSGGAREAAKPAHMDRDFLSRISGYSAGPLVGRVAFILDFQADPLLLVCCNALQVLC